MPAGFANGGCQANRAACIPWVVLESRPLAHVHNLRAVVSVNHGAAKKKASRPPMPDAFRADRTIPLLAHFFAVQFLHPPDGGDDVLEPDNPRHVYAILKGSQYLPL